LIRDTATAEGKDEEEAAKEKPYDPLMAEKSAKIGDFYFKKKNYAAAIQRYLEAISYQPNLIRAYEGLARAYEKNGKTDKAAEVYRDFLRKYPDSKKYAEFSARLEKLEKKP
jgi:tetratricopeptide (TPR) repeat protein